MREGEETVEGTVGEGEEGTVEGAQEGVGARGKSARQGHQRAANAAKKEFVNCAPMNMK